VGKFNIVVDVGFTLSEYNWLLSQTDTECLTLVGLIRQRALNQDVDILRRDSFFRFLARNGELQPKKEEGKKLWDD
jgi:hypothetical protein